MKIENYYHYHIEIKDRKITSVKLENKQGEIIDVGTFKKPVTNNKLSKLYVVKHRSEIIYVGVASRGIRNRLRDGFTAEGRGGYYGYNWKNLDSISLLIWCFPDRTLKQLETVEAEVVYLVRRNLNQWPKYQTEIHFHNVTDEEKKIAELIYEEAQ